MDASEAMELVREAILLLLVVSLPLLLTALIVGLIVSVLQAATQVSDPTLSFVPKILAVLLALVITGPWIIERIVDFGKQAFGM
ncbi:MAG: flagellar biosynthesis protein FliQ [Phycisphaerae bacterium]|nr:flagellar biosynthesis protein FliQ [Phycisphaerae bacterium]